MGKKLYEETETGGICFKSERKPWEVRVPNYVYDLWMPVLGVVDIGIYSVYCRLERENIVKAISLDNIARACRIGKSRLYDINKRLEKCGFIRVTPPEGWQKLAHYTTEITVLDPPPEVPAWAIKEYCQIKGGYQPLSPWLVKDDGKVQTEPPNVPNGTMEGPGQDIDEGPNGTPNVETLGLQPLDVESLDVEIGFSENQQGADSSGSHRPKADPLMQDLERATQAKRAEAGGNYAVHPSAGGDDAFRDGPVDAFCEVLAAIVPKQLPKKQRESWGLKLGEIAKAWSGDDRTITPEVMEAAIRAVPDDEFIGWRCFSSPYSDNFDKHIGPLLLNGGKPRQKGARHGSHQHIAKGAAPRRVATDEEARAILGDRYGG